MFCQRLFAYNENEKVITGYTYLSQFYINNNNINNKSLETNF